MVLSRGISFYLFVLVTGLCVAGLVSVSYTHLPVFCIFPFQYTLCMAGIHVVQRTQFYIFQTDEKLAYAWVTLPAAAAGKLLVDAAAFVDS